ncbi:hypothetical protein D3C84_543470 [compost metagenome]
MHGLPVLLREGAGVAGVVLEDDRATPADGRVVGGRGVVVEHRQLADQAIAGVVLLATVDQQVDASVAVVGDGDVALAEQGRGGTAALIDRADLAPGAAVIDFAPALHGLALGIGDEAVHGVVGHQVDTIGRHRHAVLDFFVGQLNALDLAGVGVQGADAAAPGDPPDQALVIGHDPGDGVAFAFGEPVGRLHTIVGDLVAQVPVVDRFERPRTGLILTMHDALDVLLGIGDDHAILFVDIEIGAGGVGHDLVRVQGNQRVESRRTRRQRVAGQQFEGAWFEQLQFELHQVGAQHHQATLLIEGMNRAHAAGLAAAIATVHLNIPAQRAWPRVRVGAVAIGMHVAAAVAGHVGVGGNRTVQRLRDSGATDQGCGAAVAGQRLRFIGFGTGTEQAEQGQGKQEWSTHRSLAILLLV